MSEQVSDNLAVTNHLFDPNFAPEVIGEFSTLFKKPEELSAALGQKGVLRSSVSLEGTAVGEVIDRVDSEAAGQGHAVGAIFDKPRVETFELSGGSSLGQYTTNQVDGLAFAILSGSASVRIGEDAAILEPGDVAFIEGNNGETTHNIAALPGGFAIGLLIGTTERAPELAQAA